MSQVRKAVITAAGWGTRFLPITKAQPKEMLPLVDRPIIQYAVEEALAAGITQIILVTAQNKQAIEDYFDSSPALEHFLEQRGELGLLDRVQHICDHADIAYVRQKKPLGLGHAVLTARRMVGEEPFALFLPDDVFISPKPVIQQMLEVYEQYGGSILAIERVSREDTARYGIIRPQLSKHQFPSTKLQTPPTPRTLQTLRTPSSKLSKSGRVYRVLDVVEKPSPQEAPSELAIMGRYILSPEIFSALEQTPPGKNQELQLTDGLRRLLKEQPVYAYEYQGTRYDTGVPLGWLKAMVSLALGHPEMGPPLKEYLKGLELDKRGKTWNRS